LVFFTTARSFASSLMRQATSMGGSAVAPTLSAIVLTAAAALASLRAQQAHLIG